MPDINRIFNAEARNHADQDGQMYDLERWSPLIAIRLARAEGIDELTEAHWQVIYALRTFYMEHGCADNARVVMQMLAADFADEGGRRYLYELFPQGPVNQGSRLAGAPVPPHASDPSFGWAA